MLLNPCKVNKTHAPVKWRTQLRGIEDRRAWRGGVQAQVHQAATDAFALVFVADNHQANRRPLALMTGEGYAHRLPVSFGDKAI